jgi:hypothetical protein
MKGAAEPTEHWLDKPEVAGSIPASPTISSIPTVGEAIEAAPPWLREAASKGQNCPRCRSCLVKYVGCVPDGIHMNQHFDCQSCGAQWEGE